MLVIPSSCYGGRYVSLMLENIKLEKKKKGEFVSIWVQSIWRTAELSSHFAI